MAVEESRGVGGFGVVGEILAGHFVIHLLDLSGESVRLADVAGDLWLRG